MATATRLITAEEFLALPDDGIDRELIEGVPTEVPMTMRAYPHSYVMSRLSHLFWSWIGGQPKPAGIIVSGEARVRIKRVPDTMVGVDLAYLSPEHAARTPRNAPLVDGPPLLVIEILSPSQSHPEMLKKMRDYLGAGVGQVWIVDPDGETVTVYRAGGGAVLYNTEQTIQGDPDFPGLVIPIAEMFEP